MFPFPNIPLVKYEDIREQIQGGDLMFANGRYAFSRILQAATKSCWSHVAFVLPVKEINRVMVLESVEGRGVRAVALSEYLRNFEGTEAGYSGRIALGRHARFNQEPLIDNDQLRVMSQFAVDRLSYPYDDEEVARITARIVAGALGLKPADMVKRNNEYICSEYVYECYKLLGIDIAYDARGFVSPADFAQNTQVSLLWELSVKPASASA